MTEERLSVVILAGGRNSPEMEAATGVSNRALVELGGQTMLSYIVDALAGARGTDRLFVVGDVPADNRYEQVHGGKTLMDNLLADGNSRIIQILNLQQQKKYEQMMRARRK